MTIKHIVLFTLNEGITRDEDRVQEAADFSASHVRHIPDIQTWETGFDTSHRVISADFAAIGTFADSEAVARYLEHPHHCAGVAKWREIAHWTTVDLTI